MRTFSILLFTVFSFVVSAQSNFEFTSLQSKGDIPEIFFPDEVKNEIAIRQWMELSHNQLDEKDAEEYVQKQNLAIGQILESGRVLFNDPVTNYLNNILDLLLEDNDSLRDQVQIFAFKSDIANAYMMPNGMMFINLGLIAETTNEAQLAFVIAHELVHYRNHHSIDRYIARLNLDLNAKQFGSKLLSYHSRSRKHESESDLQGLSTYYSNSNYSYEAIDEAFDVLQYGYLPFDELPFSRTEVETKDYVFKDKYFISQTNPISTRDNYIDTLSTHPNIKSRRLRLRKETAKLDNTGRQEFIQEEDLYYEVRDLARFECINVYLMNNDYINSYYNIRVLKKDHPNNEYLDIAEVASLYGLENYVRKQSRNNFPKYSEVEGQIHHIVWFFRKINRNELSLLALRKAWAAHLKYPDNKYLHSICDDLFVVLDQKMKVDLNDFADLGVHDTIAVENEKSKESIEGDKYDRVKEIKKVQYKKGWRTWNYMLVDLKTDTAFVNRFYEIQQLKDLNATLEMLRISDETNKTNDDDFKIIVLNPKAYKVRNIFTEDVDPEKVKDISHQLIKNFRAAADAAGIPYEIINKNNIDGMTYENYSKYMSVYYELMRQEGKKMKLYTYNQLFGDSSLSSESILFLYQVSYRKTIFDFRNLLYAAASVAQTPFIVISAYEFFTPLYKTSIYYKFIDKSNISFEEGSGEEKQFLEKLRNDYIQQFLYEKLQESL